jgi:hypothetical protein
MRDRLNEKASVARRYRRPKECHIQIGPAALAGKRHGGGADHVMLR